MKRNFRPQDVSDTWILDSTNKPKPISNKELGVPYLCSLDTRRLCSLSASLGSEVVVLGWSLGGIVAREAARDLPEHVSQVITFGTPTLCGAKYIATASGFSKQGMDLEWIEQVMLKREDVIINQPIDLI